MWNAKMIHGTGGQFQIKDGDKSIAIVPNKNHARLIAAAPDLYESLKDLLVVSTETSKRALDAQEKAHLALNKAEGK